MVAAGRRKFFYVYHLGSGRVERVARIQGMEEERSLETFAASPAQESLELAFLGNGAPPAAHLTQDLGASGVGLARPIALLP